MCIGLCLFVHLCIMTIQYPWRPEEDTESPRSEDTVCCCEPACRCWILNPRSAGRASSTLIFCAISPSPEQKLWKHSSVMFWFFFFGVYCNIHFFPSFSLLGIGLWIYLLKESALRFIASSYHFICLCFITLRAGGLPSWVVSDVRF